MIWLLLTPLSRQLARPATHRKAMKERKLANGRRGGGGAKSYDGEKAKFSINYTILSATVILTLGTTVYK